MSNIQLEMMPYLSFRGNCEEALHDEVAARRLAWQFQRPFWYPLDGELYKVKSITL